MHLTLEYGSKQLVVLRKDFLSVRGVCSPIAVFYWGSLVVNMVPTSKNYAVADSVFDFWGKLDIPYFVYWRKAPLKVIPLMIVFECRYMLGLWWVLFVTIINPIGTDYGSVGLV